MGFGFLFRSRLVAAYWFTLLFLPFAAPCLGGDRVVFSLQGRDECQARVASGLTDAVTYKVSTWSLKRTMAYQNTERKGDKEGWGPWTAALRNGVLVPWFGNQVFDPGNTDITLNSYQEAQFPFHTIELSPVPEAPEWIAVKFIADRKYTSDLVVAPPEPLFPSGSHTTWVAAARFVVGDWKALQLQGAFKIEMGAQACAAYEQVFGSPTRDVPGFGITQVCTWIESLPDLANAVETRVQNQLEPAFLEGNRGSLKFSSPSVSTELVLGVPEKKSASAPAPAPGDTPAPGRSWISRLLNRP